ncbi:MAG: tRNA (adenosine(37)-N6)-threonylcarbamoyltransferase complex ATPase subunit type 1 TsaE [Rubrimonas sp.]
MTHPAGLSATLPDVAATDRLGAALGAALRPADAVLLRGPLGAGKSALARAIILARLAAEGRCEDTPSPTYTLVQTYETSVGEIWHADLYRLNDPAEAMELGLIDAFATAICLIEWPDRLGPFAPARALDVALDIAPAGTGRTITITPHGSGWQAAMAAADAALGSGRRT